MKPSAEEQLQFLQHLQRLFEGGEFVATYKYALLMSLADLAVELGSDEGEVELSISSIAKKFAEIYWPQTAPYASGVAGSMPSVLIQNQGKQAAVVNWLAVLRAQGAATFAQAKEQKEAWSNTLRKIEATVATMPVRYLQNVGGVLVPFLYDYPHPRGKLVLKSGVAYMLRTFQPMIQQLARSGWVRHVRENRRNTAIIGRADELEGFMFGASRNALLAAGKVLTKIQSKRCFYCETLITDGGEVDHFIPWSKYPRDLAHNFVLAHAKCNRQKSDLLAAERHLSRWLERNVRYGSDIAEELPGIMADQACSDKVAYWAYEQGVTAGAYGWVEKRITEPLRQDCLAKIDAGQCR